VDDGVGVRRGGLGEGRAICDVTANKLVFTHSASRTWSQLATVPNCPCGINVEDLSPQAVHSSRAEQSLQVVVCDERDCAEGTYEFCKR
jgi:hypothetical protein